ncbi:hypothetical protein [Caulobacter sp. CCG-8]|uniref:hypothetical protein n=1 Tax=Caulobacter sp. CCG-8 TaxID=3127958 RepID=UPI00307F297C
MLRRLHARGLELPEWLALLIVGGGVTGVNGFNLGQFVLHGRFYVVERHVPNYWAYWRTDADAILRNGLWSLVIFAFGAFALATALVYPLLVMRWGKTAPGYRKLPPLSIKD